MRASSILETCIYAEDLAAAERFYSEVLGLQQFAGAEGRHVFFRCGDSVLLIFNPRHTSQQDAAPRHGALGPGHVCFRIEHEEIEGWREQLATHGIEIESELSWSPGAVSLYFRDPAGNSVELATPDTWD